MSTFVLNEATSIHINGAMNSTTVVVSTTTRKIG